MIALRRNGVMSQKRPAAGKECALHILFHIIEIYVLRNLPEIGITGNIPMDIKSECFWTNIYHYGIMVCVKQYENGRFHMQIYRVNTSFGTPFAY